MYKTIWLIKDDKNKTQFTQYHFGKTPQFPKWYMEENHIYEIEMLWNFKLIFTFKIFFKCFTKTYVIE